MTVKDVIENAGHILISNPGLFERNVQLLEQFGIDIKLCKSGKGAQILGYLNLEERLATIKEMGYDDEVLGDRLNSMEVIRACSISLNYNNSKQEEMGAQLKRCA